MFDLEAFLEYLNKIEKFIRTEIEEEVTDFFTLYKRHIPGFKFESSNNAFHSNILKLDNMNDNSWIDIVTRRMFDKGLWSDCVVSRVKILVFVLNEDLESAYQEQNVLAITINRLVQSNGRWMLRVMQQVNHDLISLAVQTSTKNLEETARHVNRSFTLCINDRAELKNSRKWGTYACINQLFKIYFRLKQQNLCTSILKAVATAELPDLHEYPKAHVITFRFYCGLLAFLDENYGLAREHFLTVLKGADKFAVANKRRVLHYLVPVNLLFGSRPSMKLLKRYELDTVYGPILESLKKGQLHIFQELLAKHEKFFVRKGTFLTWEKITMLVYRQLFYRTFKLMDSNCKLPVKVYQVGMKVAECEVALDEIQCLLANMIDKGLLKGYLSFEKQFLVLSQKQPFPSIGSSTSPLV